MRSASMQAIATNLCSTWVLGNPPDNYIWFTLWLFNIAMGNGPFIDGLPIENGDFPWLC
jgi:hypothetical protein